ncbi:MAG: FliH/SctL family protein [Nocardioidaceae bacterium]
MKSTSSEHLLLRGTDAAQAHAPGATSDLRAGTWTRLGDGSVLGDDVTERSLAALAGKAERAARAQGFAVGWAEGRRRATESAADLLAERARIQDAEHEQVMADQRVAAGALASALDRVGEALADTQEVLAARAVELALEIVAAVLQREVRTAADPGADALVRALVSVPPAVPVTVRLHPADKAALDLDVLDGRPAVVIVDPTLSRGDAVVETEAQVVDASIGAALARVREVLLP